MSLNYIQIISTQLRGLGNPKQDHFLLPLEIMKEQGAKVTVVFTTKKLDLELIEKRFGTGHHYVHTPTLLSFIRFMRKQKDAVIWANSRTLPSFVAGYFGRKRLFMSHNSSLPEKWWQRKVMKHYLKKFHAIRVANNYEKEELLRLGVKENKISVIPLVIDTKDFSKKASAKQTESFKKKYHIQSSDKIILFLAQIRVFKNLPTLLDAFKIVQRKDKDAKLLLIGEDRLQEQNHPSVIELLKEKHIAPESVVHTGALTHDQMRPAFQLAKVGVNTSLHEGMCIAAYELSCAEVPLCLSQIGSFTSVFSHENVQFHSPTDSKTLAKNILWILEHENKAKQRAKKNHQFVEQRVNYITIKKSLKELLLKVFL